MRHPQANFRSGPELMNFASACDSNTGVGALAPQRLSSAAPLTSFCKPRSCGPAYRSALIQAATTARLRRSLTARLRPTPDSCRSRTAGASPRNSDRDPPSLSGSHSRVEHVQRFAPFSTKHRTLFSEIDLSADLLDLNVSELVKNEIRMGGACRFRIPSLATLPWLTLRRQRCRS